jgi:hypothetical protein
MTLPSNALSDTELLHYAHFDDSAREELTRRFATSEGLSQMIRYEELDDELKRLQSAREEKCCCAAFDEDRDEDLQECVNSLWDLLKDYKSLDPAALNQALSSSFKLLKENCTPRPGIEWD